MSKLKFVAYTEPGIGSLTPIIEVPVLPGASGTKEHSEWSDLSLGVPSDWPYFDQLLSDTAGSIIRCFAPDGSTIIDECFVDRIPASTDVPGVRTIIGPQTPGAVEFCGIYPYNHPNHTAEWLDWVWGGDELLNNTDFAAGEGDAETQAITITVESPKHTHLVSSINASQTTFDVDSTSIFDIGDYLIVDSERMAITNISGSTLTVTRGHAGTTAASHSAGTNNVHKVPGGTFTVTYDGQTTAALDFNPHGTTGNHTSAADLETALEALSNVTDVSVSEETTTKATPSPDHSGILSSDKVFYRTVYTIEFTDPAGDIAQVTVADSIVDAAVAVTTPEPGTPGEVNDWTVAQNPDGSEIGTYVEPKIRASDSGAGEPADSLAIFARGRYAGGQTVRSVKPGSVAQASAEVNPHVTGDYVLVIRDAVTGQQIARTADTSCTASTFTTISLTDVAIPSDTEQIIFRVSLVDADPATHRSFFIRNPSMKEGLDPATPGEIVRLLVEAAQARGTFLWVDISSFSDTLDSDGNAWPTQHSFTAWADSNLGHVLSDLRSMGDTANAGYRWVFEPKATPTGTPPNELTHDLKMFVPGAGGTNHTTSPGGPALYTGNTVKGELVQRRPAFTTLLSHGAEGLYLEKTDATLEANFTRRERIADVEHLSSEASLQEYADASFGDQADNLKALRAQVAGDASKLPFVDYTYMDTVWWHFPGIQTRLAKPIRRISWTHGSQMALFDIQGSRVLSEQAGMASAVEYLLRQFKPRGRRGLTQRSGGTTTELVTGAYIHLYRASTQSIPTGGDVVQWTGIGGMGRSEFAAPIFPALSVDIPKDGYFNLHTILGWDSFLDGGTVNVIRERDGVDQTLTPPAGDPGAWSNDYGDLFKGTVHAIPCRKGDTLRVEVDSGDAATQTLSSATLVVYQVDRAPETTQCVAVAEWRFNETSGSTAVDELGLNDGTYNGTPTLNEDGPAGGSDRAVRFTRSAAADYVSVPDVSLWDFNVFSVEVWAKTTETGTGDGPGADVVGQGRTSTTNRNWTVYEPFEYANGELQFAVGTDGGDLKAVMSSGFRDGGWHHIIGTWDGQTVRLYVDGTLIDSDTTGSPQTIDNNSAGIEMGRNEFPDAGWTGSNLGWFDGWIGRVRLWPCALTEAEVVAAYNEGSA